MMLSTVLTLCIIASTLLCLQINAQPRNVGLSQRGSMFHRGMRPMIIRARRPTSSGSAQVIGTFHPLIQPQYLPRSNGQRQTMVVSGNRRRFPSRQQGFSLPMTFRQNAQGAGRTFGNPDGSAALSRTINQRLSAGQPNRASSSRHLPNQRHPNNKKHDINIIQRNIVVLNGKNDSRSIQEASRMADQLLHRLPVPNNGRARPRGGPMQHSGVPLGTPLHTGGSQARPVGPILPNVWIPSRRTSNIPHPILIGSTSSLQPGAHPAGPQTPKAAVKTHVPQGTAAAAPAPVKVNPTKQYPIAKEPVITKAPAAPSGKPVSKPLLSNASKSHAGMTSQSTKLSPFALLSNKHGMIHIDDLLKMTKQLVGVATMAAHSQTIKPGNTTKPAAAPAKKGTPTKGKSKKATGKGAKVKKVKPPVTMNEAIEMIRGSSLTDILSSAMQNPGNSLRDFIARVPGLGPLPKPTGDNKLMKGIENLFNLAGPSGLSIDLLERFGLTNSTAVINTGNVQQDKMISDLLREVKKNVLEEAVESLAKGRKRSRKLAEQGRENTLISNLLMGK